MDTNVVIQRKRDSQEGKKRQKDTERHTHAQIQRERGNTAIDLEKRE